jgi:hypothetical protein
MEKIHLISRDSHLKGDWWEWTCEKELPDGTFVIGYIQADGTGNMFAPETFEAAE